ncbi:hypothetical protein IM977_004538 [Salmonella enterica subsp. enterica serovar Typhimurium]|nr:hypothetical protein [Salmonella enterica subsp. enterica serovar Typhimurium]
MKLTVSDIRFSASGPVNVLATVDVESGKSLSPICSISVTAPMVEGQAIRDYDEYLKNKAREIITKMYKEIVCGGQISEAGGLLDYLGGKIEPSELGKEMLEQIHDAHSNHDLEERVAVLEKRLDAQTESCTAREIYAVGKKAAEDFLSQQGKRPGQTGAHNSNKSITFYHPDGTVRVELPSF